MNMRIQTIVMQSYPAAQCLHGYPAVECMTNPYTCPCGYAEGLSKPRYPMPAIIIEIDYGMFFDDCCMYEVDRDDIPRIVEFWYLGQVVNEEKLEAMERHWLSSVGC